MKKTLYLIRHGQALHNINFIKYGSNTYYSKMNLDSPLTKTGIEQAKIILKLLLPLLLPEH